MSKSVLIHRTSLGKLIIRLGMAIVILLIPVSSYSLPYQSPRTQNVEQTNVPDYYNKAKTAVRKYYPKYEEYFKEIFNSTDRLNKQLIDVINYNLDNGIKKSKDEIKTEKQIYTVILMTIEKIN